MGIFKALMSGLGLEQEDEVISERQSRQENVSPIVRQNEKQESSEQNVSVSSLVCYAPKNNNDVKTLVEYLKGGKPCIVNLGELSEQELKSVLDFLGGAVYALGGTISRLQGNLFVMSPKDMKITTK
ncbi:MAG: cell division protein SepF [Clostridiales bacterium]|nr:cell division protein SepF [Candidatus Apopatousia equi]